MTKKQAAWGEARLEMDALRNEILARLTEVPSARRLYQELRNAGRLTVSPAAFYRHVKRWKAEQRADGSNVATPTPEGAPDVAKGQNAHASTDTAQTGTSAPAGAASAAADKAVPPWRQPMAIEGLRELPRRSIEELWDGDGDDEGASKGR